MFLVGIDWCNCDEKMTFEAITQWIIDYFNAYKTRIIIK